MGLSCNLEVVERLAVQLSSNERVEKNNCNVRKNRMGSGVESESRCLCPESSTRDFLLSFLLFPLLSSLPSVCARLSGSLFRSSPAISVMSAWPCEPHKRKWHFCVPVTNASRNNFVFFVDYLLRDSFPRRNFWPLSLPSRVRGRRRERERERSVETKE